jgi:hypothetical protein
MKQLFQDARSAEITVVEVPAPKLLAGCVLVRTAASVVSAGTERASSEFAGKNLLQKARMRPDLVREVLSKISRDGLLATVSTVRSRLDQPSALGYSSAGTVVAVGEGVADINPGDRVACAGAGHAVHAEFACVPRLLRRANSFESVSFDEACLHHSGSGSASRRAQRRCEAGRRRGRDRPRSPWSIHRANSQGRWLLRARNGYLRRTSRSRRAPRSRCGSALPSHGFSGLMSATLLRPWCRLRSDHRAVSRATIP